MSLELSIDQAATRRPASALTSTAGVAELFAPLVADSPALVWIKDLEGRYLHVNPRHAEQLGVDELKIRGLTDADLRPGQAVDDPRLADGSTDGPEQLEGEYTIESYQDRPALAAWRFPIHGANGEPLAICGVAAPVRDAGVARRERARLVELSRAPQRTDRDLWRDDPRQPDGTHPATDDRPVEPQHAPQRADDGASTQHPAAEVADPQGSDQNGRVERLGESLAAAGDRVLELERLLVDARAPFEELSRLIEEARHAQAVAVESTERVAELEQRLEAILTELEVVRKAHARDAAALSAESQLRSEWEARADEALGRIEELEATLAEVRTHNYQLENTVAHAEVSVATSAQEANSARLRAEAARLDAEAARLEAQAYRQDVETAKLEAESSRHDVELAQQEANRFRLAAEAAFEQMHAVRGEWEATRDASPDVSDVGPFPSDFETPTAGQHEVEREAEAGASSANASHAEAEAEESPAESPHQGAADEDTEVRVSAVEAEGRQAGGETEVWEREADAEPWEPETEPELWEPEAEPETQEPETEPESWEPEAEPEAQEPAVEPEAQAPVTEAETRQPAAEAEPRNFAWQMESHATELTQPAAEDEPLTSSDEGGTEAEENQADHVDLEPEVTDAEKQSPETGDAAAEEEVAAPTVAALSSPLTWSHSAKLSLTAALVDCNSSRTVFAEAVRVIGSRGGWDSVIAWTLDARAKRYTVTAMWCATDEMAPFEEAIRQLRQDPKESTIGRVAASGQITWFADPGAEHDANLARAADEGMNLVVVLPVLREGETVAVLELCSRHEGEPDEALRTALEAMASELIFVQQLLSASESPRWPVWRRR